MKRESVKIARIMLVLGIVLALVLPANVALGQTTIYVDGSNTTGPWDGTAANPYQYIQDGVDAAVSEDTVQVAAGTYYENIILKDGVSVQGAGAGVTTINGNGGSLAVTAYNIGVGTKLEGFTITNPQSGGIAIWIDGNSYLSISNNTIIGCDDEGILVGNSSPSIVANIIIDNGSAGIQMLRSSPNIINNIVADNDGEGILIVDSSPTIGNNTIVSNVWQGIQSYDSSPIITNCIIWGNKNDLDGCSATYSDIKDGDVGLGNISQDPLFVDPGADDYHLQAGSPCINVGDNAAPSLPSTDFEGDPRIWPEGEVVDMGADEYYALPQIEEFAIEHMFIDFDRRPNKDDIDITKATFSLQEDATYDLAVDDVLVSIDGVDIAIPAGSFKQLGRGERYIYNSPRRVEPKIVMVLNFDRGKWSLLVHDIDASAVDNSDGVDVTFAIGSISASEHINMCVERLSYRAGP